MAFFVAVCALLGALAPVLRWLSTRAGDVVLANFDGLAGALSWITLATIVLLVAALNTRSTLRAVVAVAIVVVVASGFAYRFVYGGFVAVNAGNDRVTLRFVWPRPSAVLDPSTIAEAKLVDAIEDEGDSQIRMYRLEVTTQRGHWRSCATSHHDAAERALAMIQRATGQRARR